MSEQLIIAIQEAVQQAVAPLHAELRQLHETLGERALSVTQLAHLAGVSRHTIYRRIDDGTLPVASQNPVRILYSEYRRSLG